MDRGMLLPAFTFFPLRGYSASALVYTSVARLGCKTEKTGAVNSWPPRFTLKIGVYEKPLSLY